MTYDHRRKKSARDHQAAHGGDYTDARRATERSPRNIRRRHASALLAVTQREVCTGLVRAVNRPPLQDRSVRRLVETILKKIDELPARFDRDTGRLWNVVMSGGWGTVAEVRSARIRSIACFISELVVGLDNAQLVAAATDLGVSDRDVSYFARAWAEGGIEGSGRPSLVAAIADSATGRRPGADAALLADAQVSIDMALVHLRDRSARTWDEFDRKVMQQSVLVSLASLGDAYINAGSEPAIPGLSWRRLSDGSMRADLAIPGSAQPISALVQVTPEKRLPIWTPKFGPEFFTEFYPTGRTHRRDAYRVYVGVLDVDESSDQPDASILVCDEQSTGVYSQIGGQHAAAEALAEILTSSQ